MSSMTREKIILLSIVALIFVFGAASFITDGDLTGWYRLHFSPDKQTTLYVMSDTEDWSYGTVKACISNKTDDHELVSPTRWPHLERREVLECDGPYLKEPYLSREEFAITFKSTAADFNLWSCVKTPEGITCK